MLNKFYLIRSVIEKIDEYRKKKANALLVEDGRNIINAIYTEDNSSYEYLNYFYKYSTLASVEINILLFDTERGNFLQILKEIEIRAKTLVDDQYQDTKKYLIHSANRSVLLLYSPVKLDNSHFITIDKETISEGNPIYWETKTCRIYGLREEIQNNLDINFWKTFWWRY